MPVNPIDHPNDRWEVAALADRRKSVSDPVRSTPRWALPLVLLTGAGVLAACQRGDAPAFAVQPLATPAAAGSAQPHLSPLPGGGVVMSWQTRDENGARLRHASLVGGQWSSPVTVASGEDWFVNWADFPSVTPISDSFWAAHWLAKRPGGTYAYDVAIALSTDGGQRWGAPLTPHHDGSATEHGFVTLFPWQGEAAAVWLDGRQMAADGGHGDGAHGGEGGMTLRTTRIDANGNERAAALIDALVCDCCQTDVALAAAGPVVVYRNRTEAEIRDIYVARATDAGWQSGVPVADDGWEIAGCPVNGPAIAARGVQVAVAWFTAAGGSAKVRLAFSADGGASFSAPVDVDVERPIGRVDIELLDDGSAAISWLAHGSDGSGEIRLRRVQRDGIQSASYQVAQTAAARASGFPQMLAHDGQLLFAWTEASDEYSEVKAALVTLPRH